VFFAAATRLSNAGPSKGPAPPAMGSDRQSLSPPDAIEHVDEQAVFRVGVEDEATVAIAAVGRLGMPDLSFDGRWLLAPVAASDGSVRVLSAAVDGRPAPSPAPVDVVKAVPGEAPAAARPLPQLRIQP
jgi:hypothetical protein